MSSVGIPEGTIIQERITCECLWMCLTSYPAKWKLERKCNYCKEKEGLPVDPEEKIAGEHLVIDALDAVDSDKVFVCDTDANVISAKKLNT